MNSMAVRGAFGRSLAPCELRSFGWCHDQGPPRSVFVVEQHRRELPAHVRHNRPACKAGASTRFSRRCGRTFRDLEGTERALHSAEIFVRGNSIASVELLFRQTGSNDVEAVERGFGGDAVVVPAPRERTISRMKCFFILATASWQPPGRRVCRCSFRPRFFDRFVAAATAAVSAACNRASRLRTRSFASRGLRQTTRRSPG